MNIYLFLRSEGFYAMEFESDEVAIRNAEVNPGTKQVIRPFPEPEEIIWRAEETTNPL